MSDGRARARTTRHPGLPPQGDWIHQAACTGHPPEHWYIAARDGTYTYARPICDHCPVRVDCLDWALRTGEKHGLWGGKSPDERRRLRGQRRAS